MSEQPHDADPGYGSVAQPAVDVLPVHGSRGRPAEEPAPEPDQTWPPAGSAPAAPVQAVNPWTGQVDATAAPSPAWLAVTPQASYPEPFATPPAAVPASPPADSTVPAYPAVPAKRFLGMQLRRPRKDLAGSDPDFPDLRDPPRAIEADPGCGSWDRMTG